MTAQQAAQPAVWLGVPNWPWYQVDPIGMRVRSIDRTAVDRLGRRRFRRGQMLVATVSARGGGPRVNLCHGPRRRTLRVEQIANTAVAAAADRQGGA